MILVPNKSQERVLFPILFSLERDRNHKLNTTDAARELGVITIIMSASSPAATEEAASKPQSAQPAKLCT